MGNSMSLVEECLRDSGIASAMFMMLLLSAVLHEFPSCRRCSKLVVLSSTHTETVLANDLGRWDCVTGET